MSEAIKLIKEMLQDLDAWHEAFPDCEETTAIINKAHKFLEEHDEHSVHS